MTDPPGAMVTLEGAELKPEDGGALVGQLAFPPVDDKGGLKTYAGTVAKKTDGAEWETAPLKIGWDDGREEYKVTLREISRRVPLIRPAFARDGSGWHLRAERLDTSARVDVAEPSGAKVTRLTYLPKGSVIDSLAVSPDGQQVAFTVVAAGEKDELTSQLYTVNADGTGAVRPLLDGRGLDLMPSYSPDGSRILFSSSRTTDADERKETPRPAARLVDGRRRHRRPRPLTGGDTFDLWPTLDSLPKPRLFYEALVPSRQTRGSTPCRWSRGPRCRRPRPGRPTCRRRVASRGSARERTGYCSRS